MSSLPAGRPTPRRGSVQSLDRAIDLLDHLADRGGQASLSELAAATDLPPPTIHRLMRTLLARGYVRQLPSRRYGLGLRLLRLADGAGRQLGAGAGSRLAELANSFGESANLAMLDRTMVVYVAQESSGRTMRMFTEVGRRVHAHCTGVGKAILAQLDDDEVAEIVASAGMPAVTDRSITDLPALLCELATIRERGFAIDDGEQEVGVRCYAVALPGVQVPAAVSLSGPDSRVTDDFGLRAVPALHDAATLIAAEAG